MTRQLAGQITEMFRPRISDFPKLPVTALFWWAKGRRPLGPPKYREKASNLDSTAGPASALSHKCQDVRKRGLSLSRPDPCSVDFGRETPKFRFEFCRGFFGGFFAPMFSKEKGPKKSTKNPPQN